MQIAPLLALGLAAMCELCDEMGISPYGRSPFGMPACSTPNTIIEADPWPKAGEIRRTDITRECVDVELRRAFVEAPNGFAPGELFALAKVTSKRGARTLKELSQSEFIGRRGERSYRYTLSFAPDGAVQRAAGSVEPRPLTSRLIASSLAPSLRAASDMTQHIDCDAKSRRCEVWQSSDADAARRFFVVQIDRKHPAGNLCVDVPLRRRGQPAPSADVFADDEKVVAGLKAENEAGFACLGAASAGALAKLAVAKRIVYQVQRAASDPKSPADWAELDTGGLGDGLELVQYLYKTEIVDSSRAQRVRRSERAAETLLAPAL